MKPLTPQTDINGRKRKSKVESGSLTKRSLIFDDMEEWMKRPNNDYNEIPSIYQFLCQLLFTYVFMPLTQFTN